MYIYLYIYPHAYTHTHTHTHTYIYIYIYTHTHRHIFPTTVKAYDYLGFISVNVLGICRDVLGTDLCPAWKLVLFNMKEISG